MYQSFSIFLFEQLTLGSLGNARKGRQAPERSERQATDRWLFAQCDRCEVVLKKLFFINF
jgi:hypothetical protein